MIRRILAASIVLFAPYAFAQQFEAVYTIDGISGSDAKAAMEDLFSDPEVKGTRVTLYAADFGVTEGSLKIVADYDDYADRAKYGDKRRDSHGWSRYLLATQDSEVVAGEMASVVADFGEQRHTAEYLFVYLMHVKDPGAYVPALEELNKAQGNPGVLRLVSMRTGPRGVTHAVLVGGDSFAAVNEYLDELYASDAYAAYTSKVGENRKVVHIESYRRLGAWGY